MMIFTDVELTEGCQGSLKISGIKGSISTDTRTIQEGVWFVALVGERFDAHNFLDQARQKGCAGVIAQRVPNDWDRGFIEVPDTLIALQNLARFARDRFEGPVVGITGSAGKTTTRQMISLALGSLGKVHATKGNLNNHIGLPLSILAAPKDAELWVLEMGMNALKEIDLLQGISKPTHRVITNVAAAHLEGLGTIENVALAKGELFDGAREGDVLFVNVDDELIRHHPTPLHTKKIFVGRDKDADFCLQKATLQGNSTYMEISIKDVEQFFSLLLPSPGLHLAQNATLAFAVAQHMGAKTQDIIENLQNYTPVGARLRMELGPTGYQILNDVYNANPLSMLSSIQTLVALPKEKVSTKIALLGDMLEMGDQEIAHHQTLVEDILELKLHHVVLVGPRFQQAFRNLCDDDIIFPFTISAVSDSSYVAAELQKRKIFPFDQSVACLCKGSRGIKMERCIEDISSYHQ